MKLTRYLKNLKDAIFGREPKPEHHHHHHTERRVGLNESREEDSSYRKIAGGSWRRKVKDLRRDDSWGEYDRHLVTCQELWKEHPVAKKGIGNLRAFVAGEGFMIRSLCKNRAKRRIIQRYIDSHYKRNGWLENLSKRVQTLFVEGEWNWYVNPPNPANGEFQIGKVDPEEIVDVAMLETNREQADIASMRDIWTEVSYDLAGQATKREFQEMQIVRRHADGRLRGNLLRLEINAISGQARGYSELFAVADYLDQLDHLVDTETERIKALRAYVWKVLLKGDPNSKEMAARKSALEKKKAPPPGSILFYDEGEEWTTDGPSLNSHETIKFAEFLLMLIFGGLNMPPHWFADGGDVNKATASEMGTPVYAHVRDMKNLIMQFLLNEHELQLFHLLEAGMLAIHGITADDLAIEVLSRDPERATYNEIGNMLSQVAKALKDGQDSEWISPENAARAYRTAATQLGLGEFDEITPSKKAIDAGKKPAQGKGDFEQARLQVAESLENYRVSPPKREWMRINNRHWVPRAA